MNETDKELVTAKRALGIMQRALKALKDEVYPKSPKTYIMLSEPYVDYIAKLRREIEELTGEATAVESSLPLWIRLRGRAVGEGSIPIDLLEGFLKNFRLGVQRVAEYKSTGLIRERGRRKEEIERSCNLRVRVIPGSLKIGVSPPLPGEQVTLDGEFKENPAEEAIKSILKGASWAVGVDAENIESLFPDTTERFIVLSEVDKISRQIGEDISGIEFRGRYVPEEREVILNRKSRDKVREAIEKRILTEEAVFEGIMREIDLDKNHFILRKLPEDEPEEIQCRYQEELETDAMKNLNKRVRVIGEMTMSELGRPKYVNVRNITSP